MSNKYTQFYSLHTIKNQKFTGDVTLEQLLSAGDFGIGTFNNTNGELIAVDGNIYRTCHDGSAEKITDLSEKTPYSIMTHFVADKSVDIAQALDMPTALQNFDAMLVNPDEIHAISISGEFKSICTRAPEPQYPPYKDLETLIAEQRESHFENIKGDIVGFYTPDYLGALGVPGYHLHFIDASRKFGGHVKSFTLSQAAFSIQKLDDISVSFPGGSSTDVPDGRKVA